MASAAQSLANQQNSQHSTGPRTEEGKRASSQNALRHGLTSQLVLLPTEDHAAYTRLHADLAADLKPVGASEEIIVQSICDTQWRLERARRTEAGILGMAQYEELPTHLAAIEDPAERQRMAEVHAWIKHERVLRNLQHHEARLQRLLLKTLDDLKGIQHLRQTRTELQMDEAVNTKIHHRFNNLPFDPAALGFVFTDSEIDRDLKRIHVLHDPQRVPSPYLGANA